MKYIKKIKNNAIILCFILLIILYFVLKDDFNNIVSTLLKANLGWVLLATLFVVIYWLFKTICFHMIVKEYSHKIKFKDLFKVTLITQFFNGITPFSSGGQPMEVYYLSKLGIKATKGTNIILQNFILYQIALIVHGLLAIFLNYKFHFFAEITILKELTLIGFIINTLVGVGLLFISFSNKFNSFVIKLVINIGHKLKLIKNREDITDKWLNRLSEFHEGASLLAKKKSLFVKGFLYNFLGLGFFYLIPLFVIYAMNYFDINAIEAITSSAYVLIIGSFVPIPGGSGGIEYGFSQFFGNFIKGPVLGASLLVWRFITYYLGIICGAVAINFFKGDVKK